jgi:LysR family transcriptional regulator, hydrogen peroxide-inducible genes activator
VRPTLRQLEYLVAVADHRSFGKAAAAAFVTQPALSVQIAQLETQLDVQLFERSPKGVMVTPIGARLVEQARAVLLATDDLVATAKSEHAMQGRMRLGVIPTLSPYLLPAILPSLRASLPELNLELIEEKTPALVDQLFYGRLDCALLALPPAPGLAAAPIMWEPFMAALSADDPLAQHDVIDEADLMDQRVMLLEEGHCLRDQTIGLCSQARISDVRATSLTTVVQMVASGFGATLLPAIAVGVELRGMQEVVARPLADTTAGRDIGLCWRSTGPGERFVLLAAAMGNAITARRLVDPSWESVRTTVPPLRKAAR